MVNLELGDDLVAILQREDAPVDRAAVEMIVLELYRRGTISSGKAAELLDIERREFIKRASALGIAYFDVTEDEWRAEVALVRSLR